MQNPCFKPVSSTCSKPPHWGQAPLWWFRWLEDELMIVGRGYAAFGGSAEGGEGIARERHGPAQPAAGGDRAGQRHNAPGHTGGKTQLFAFHHIEGAIERHDYFAFVFGGITGRPSRCASRYAAAAASSSAVCPQPPQPQVQGSDPSQVQGSPVSGQISCDTASPVIDVCRSRRAARLPQTPRAY